MKPNSALRIPLVVAALAVALGAAAPAAAQFGDEGVFRVTIGGREAGTEEFAIRQTGSGANVEFVATGRVRVMLPGGSLDLQPRLRAGGLDAAPAAYQVEIGGDAPRRMVGSISGGRFTARTATAAGEQMREFIASSGAVVLDDYVAHHYFFLARRVRTGRVPVILPRENRQVMATVTDRGESRVEVNGASVPLFHIVVQPDGLSVRHVWLDALGRVVRVEIPDAGYLAVRTELPR